MREYKATVIFKVHPPAISHPLPCPSQVDEAQCRRKSLAGHVATLGKNENEEHNVSDDNASEGCYDHGWTCDNFLLLLLTTAFRSI